MEVRYEPSAYEQLWFRESAKGRICALTGAQIEGVAIWLKFAIRFHEGGARQRSSPQATNAERSVLSRFVRGSEQEFIEPLTGLARHPLTPIWNCARKARAGGSNSTLRSALGKLSPTGVLDTKYIVPANWCGRPRPPRTFFFDLGTSVPSDNWGEDEQSSYGGVPPTGSKADRSRQAAKRAAEKAARVAEKAERTTGKAFGALKTTPKLSPKGVSSVNAQVIDGHLVAYSAAVEDDLEGIGFSSLTFFSRLYAANCLAFDRIYAWEAAPYNAANWWRHVPLAVRAKLTFFNLPAESVRGSLSSGGESGGVGGGVSGGVGGGAHEGSTATIGTGTDGTGSGTGTDGIDGAPKPPLLSPSDPLALILAVARPEDFVVLKVMISLMTSLMTSLIASYIAS